VRGPRRHHASHHYYSRGRPDHTRVCLQRLLLAYEPAAVGEVFLGAALWNAEVLFERRECERCKVRHSYKAISSSEQQKPRVAHMGEPNDSEAHQCTVLCTVTLVLPRLSDAALAISVMTVPVGAVTFTVIRIVHVVPGAMPLPSWQTTGPVAPTAG
jgi:hypothetical protein